MTNHLRTHCGIKQNVYIYLSLCAILVKKLVYGGIKYHNFLVPLFSVLKLYDF